MIPNTAFWTFYTQAQPAMALSPPDSTGAPGKKSPVAQPNPFRRIGIAIGLLIAIWALMLAAGCNPAQKKGPQFQTAKIDRATVTAKVSATGNLNAIVTVQVGSQVSGRINSLHVDFNSVVKKGQLLATIDPALFQAIAEMSKANVLAAQGNLLKARAQAKDAERQYKRNQMLFEQKIIAQADLDTSEANAEAAVAQVKADEGALAQAQAALDQAQLNLSYTSIVSPVDGIVVSRNIDLGQTVAAAFTAPTLFLIAEDLTKMQIDTSVAEADVGRLHQGMTATFTVDAYPGQEFEGKILQVRNNPTTISNVVTYDAVIDVNNDKLYFKPGMTANVIIVTGTAPDTLRIPNAAIRFQPPGAPAAPAPAAAASPSAAQKTTPPTPPPSAGERMVWVLRDGKPYPARVKTGITDGTFTEIKSGDLNEGDLVITDVLNPGSGSNAFRAF